MKFKKYFLIIFYTLTLFIPLQSFADSVGGGGVHGAGLPLAVNKGGTGATTAAGAAVNLSVLPLTGGAVNGDVSITATTGIGLKVTSSLAHWTQQILGSTSSGNSFGLDIAAGTNSSDYTLRVENATSSNQLFNITGDGSVTVGSPTGGGKGLGVINAQGLYVNGAPVLKSYAAQIYLAGAIDSDPGAWISSVTHSTTGVYVLNNNFSTTNTICTATTNFSQATFIAVVPASNYITVYTWNQAGTLTDYTFNIICQAQ